MRTIAVIMSPVRKGLRRVGRDAVAGKWQLHGGTNGSLAPDCGFDTFCLWNYPGARRERFWNPGIVRDGIVLETTPKDYGPDIFTDYIIEFIQKNKARPFFAYYPMVLVHSPFLPTPDSQASQKNKKDRALENFRDMTAYADKCVGRIVDALEKNGLREKTVVIYTTDNGTGRSLTYPFRDEMRDGEKAYATDGGSHAPLIVNCPGTVPAGIVTDDLVEFSDVMPTLAHISGATLPNVTLDGRSFWPQCQGRPGNPRQWIFQYYYPKFAQAAKKHGQGIKGNEIVWAQNQRYKLYRDGSFYATADRHETQVISPDTGPAKAEDTRRILQAAIDAMPAKAAKLMAANKSSNPAKARQKDNKAVLERPNIVLVMTDDQGWGQTGYYNHPVLKTPNLDTMAQNGLRFDRFYAGAPLLVPGGHGLGTLCVIDPSPRMNRPLTAHQVGALEALSRQTVRLLEYRRVGCELAEALATVRTLSPLVPICAWCRKIRDDSAYWSSVEDYLSANAGVQTTHGICPSCADDLVSGPAE